MAMPDVDHAPREALREGEQTGGVGHRRGDGHQLGAGLALLDERLGEGGGVAARLRCPDVVHPLDRVVLRRPVAPALLGEDVDHLRATGHGRRVAQGLLEGGDVVAVEGAGVAHAERLEEGVGLPQLTDGGLGGVEASLQPGPHHGHLGEDLLETGLAAHVHRVVADLHQALAQLRHGRCVGAAVVVEDDDAVAPGVAQVVEALEGHAAGHRAVTDDGHDAPVPALDRLGGREPVGIAQHRGGVAVLDPVVLGLGARRVARHAAGLAEVVEALEAPGDHLVGVGLVAGVPQDDVVGGVEHTVQGQGELDHAEVGAEVAPVGGDRLDDGLAHLRGEDLQLGLVETLQIGRGLDRLEDHEAARSLPVRR
jgi:hypothetical protein